MKKTPVVVFGKVGIPLTRLKNANLKKSPSQC